jgi:hypothetical protein
LESEQERWRSIYPQFSKNIRLVSLKNRPALLLPHFDHPRREELVLKAIEKILSEDYRDRGFKHDDVAWRDVGIRREKSGCCV